MSDRAFTLDTFDLLRRNPAGHQSCWPPQRADASRSLRQPSIELEFGLAVYPARKAWCLETARMCQGIKFQSLGPITLNDVSVLREWKTLNTHAVIFLALSQLDCMCEVQDELLDTVIPRSRSWSKAVSIVPVDVVYTHGQKEAHREDYVCWQDDILCTQTYPHEVPCRFLMTT